MGRTKHRPLTSNDCQDARNEALIAESRIAVSYRSDRRCRVAAGEWLTPYSNTVVTDPSKLDVDHTVPLGNAHRSGAWQWSADQRKRYANFMDNPQHLIAVTANGNRSNGAWGPGEWKSDAPSYWCLCATDWITIKSTWALTVTQAKHDALAQMLNTCSDPRSLWISHGSIQGEHRSTATPEPPPGAPLAVRTYSSCDAAQAAGETRVQGSSRRISTRIVPSARRRLGRCCG